MAHFYHKPGKAVLKFIANDILFSRFPGLFNALYNGLPWRVLGFLIGHQIIEPPKREVFWPIRLSNKKTLRIIIRENDDFSFGYAIHYKWHDVGLKRLQEFLLDYYDQSLLYLDVGANIGTSSIYALASGRPVWMFEANPALKEFVLRLFAENQFTSYIWEGVALSNRQGKQSFYISQSSFLSSFDQTHAAREGQVKEVVVETNTLDYYWQTGKFPRPPKIVKIDVEGHELQVLEGAAQLITDCRPAMIVEVIQSPAHRAEVYEFFAGRDYECFSITDCPKLRLRQINSAELMENDKEINFLFLHRTDEVRQPLAIHIERC
jgi:FkbM family methyltransferase